MVGAESLRDWRCRWAVIPFEDDRVPPSEWEQRKPNTPFGALPVLEVDGQTLAQSNAINH
jgi:glutathione S-transferase